MFINGPNEASEGLDYGGDWIPTSVLDKKLSDPSALVVESRFGDVSFQGHVLTSGRTGTHLVPIMKLPGDYAVGRNIGASDTGDLRRAETSGRAIWGK
jgi:hypothetical protein